MLVETVPIIGLTRETYDALLASGWFRGAGSVYKSDLLCLDEDVFSVQHIRVAIDGFQPDPKQKKILRRAEGKFRIEIGQPFINGEKEQLYRRHSSKFKAFVHESLSEILYEYDVNPEVSTLELTVLEGNRIVALSYFDVAKDSMASLLCVYDEAYSKYSPGHYTMLLEIEYGRSRGAKYYYPGYVLDRPSSFDYKLSLGSMERLNQENQWVAAKDYVRSESIADIIRDKMKELKVMLSVAGIHSRFKVYPYFTLSFVVSTDIRLLNLPCYFEFEIGNKVYAASYDIHSSQFVVVRIEETEELIFNHQLMLSEEYMRSDVYEFRVMKSNKGKRWELFQDEILQRKQKQVQ